MKIVVYLVLALIAMLLGGKKIKENPKYPDVKSVEEDVIFLESMQFWPSWRDLPADTLLGLKEETLDLFEEGLNMDSVKIGLLSRYPENSVQYLLDAINGIYLSPPKDGE